MLENKNAQIAFNQIIKPSNDEYSIINELTSPIHRPPAPNNFNTDFYRLCSDTFYYGSDANLNPMPSSPNHYSVQSSHLNFHPNAVATNTVGNLMKESSNSEFQHERNTSDCQTSNTNTLTAHVNNLFDQWLLNSASTK